MSTSTTHLRSIYRALLRELPPQHPRIKFYHSPLGKHIRNSFTLEQGCDSDGTGRRGGSLQEAEQFLQYMKSQRLYVSLLEKYNSDMGIGEAEKVRLTARRVGMELPRTCNE
ncbi:hypothetical protein GcC1_036007 [Golovinomyces cichoracearum]|uniref:Uncharacterized protein n=1 Tax=Golovinomyces cichoracearum TaxID=62708 RepID=A0A420J0V5_9PEZI|nr:hypothetical protein GcC1_036007 [Golovinomyces cichoracearum]